MSFFLVFLLVPLITARSLPLNDHLFENTDNGLLRRYNGAGLADFDRFYLNSSSERPQYKRYIAAIETLTAEHTENQASVPPLNESLSLSLSTPANARSDSKSKDDTRRSSKLVARQHDDVETCLSNSGVKTFYSPKRGMMDYADYMESIWNEYFPAFPKVAVVASTIQEVQWAISCAAAAKLPVQPRAGGHSWAGYSSGYNGNTNRQGDVVVIDIQALDKIDYDENDKTITVGGGVQLGPLSLALLKNGRAISHGECAGVGIAGHALHGGVGWTTRMWGPYTDFVIGMTVVNARGELEQLSDTKNPDLFWISAMKGAGSSFAVAVSLKLKTAPAPEQVTELGINIYGLTPAVAAQLFIRIQSCVQSGDFDRYLGLRIGAISTPNRISGPGISFRLDGYYFGSKGSDSHVQRVLSPCLQKAGLPKLDLKALNYEELLISGAEPSSLEKPEGGYPVGGNFEKLSSITLPEELPPTEAMMLNFFSALARSSTALFAQFRLMGGTDSRLPFGAESTAISYRNSLWAVGIGTRAEGLADDIERIRLTLVYNINEQVNYALTTFVDGRLRRDEAQKRYISKDRLAKLRRIKTANDPENLFRNLQSIEPQYEMGEESASSSQ